MDAFVTSLSQGTSGYWDSALSKVLSWTLGELSGGSDAHPLRAEWAPPKCQGDRFQGHRLDWRGPWGTWGCSVKGTLYASWNWAQPSFPCSQSLPQKLTWGEGGLWGRHPGQRVLHSGSCRWALGGASQADPLVSASPQPPPARMVLLVALHKAGQSCTGRGGGWRGWTAPACSQHPRAPRLGSETSWASLVAQLVKSPPAVQETPVWSLDREDPLEKGQATHSSVLGLPWWLSWYRIRLQCGRPEFDPWVGKLP